MALGKTVIDDPRFFAGKDFCAITAIWDFNDSEKTDHNTVMLAFDAAVENVDDIAEFLVDRSEW